MKLSILPHVLFDEFPKDDSIKYCIFTRPKYPEKDYSKYIGKVKFYCAIDTMCVMAGFTKTPKEMYILLQDRRTEFRMKSTPTFGIRSISNGYASTMVLIDIEGTVHLYTGQFTQCREVVLTSIMLHYKNRVTDIHVDNTTAGLRNFDLIKEARDQIENIVKTNSDCIIYLNMELFGYEDLLIELARIGLRIQLTEPQKVLFNQINQGDLFKFDGTPQIKVYLYSSGKCYKQNDYERLFDNHKIIHIKLVAMQIEERPVKIIGIKGLYHVPYTPHPTTFVLYSLFHALKPKRVHPLIPQKFNDDTMCVIPEDILNDDCKIVGFNLDEMNEVEESQVSERMDENGENTFLDLSAEMSDTSAQMSDSAEDFHYDEPSYQEPIDVQPIEHTEEKHFEINIDANELGPIEISDDESVDKDLGLPLKPIRQVTSLKIQCQTNECEAERTVPNQIQTETVQQNDAVDRIERTTVSDSNNLSNHSQSSVNRRKIESNKDAQSHGKKISKRSKVSLGYNKGIEWLTDSEEDRSQSSTSHRSQQEGNLQSNEEEANTSVHNHTDNDAQGPNDANNNEEMENPSASGSNQIENSTNIEDDVNFDDMDLESESHCVPKFPDGNNDCNDRSLAEYSSDSESECFLVFPD